ncbi:hypothetical protein LJC49_02450 [Ruminococcaceae bacterium OttesenSCG-928-I18]|nr:hypothetical protein [Ruminococcaceae bacterium OttesenSCG-928-I18]
MAFLQKMQIKKIDKMQPPELEQFIQSTEDELLREHALSRMSQEQLARCLYFLRDASLRDAIFSKTQDPLALYLIVKNVENKETSDRALSLLQDQNLLADIVIKGQSEKWYQSISGEAQQQAVRLAAANKITEQSLLQTIAAKVFDKTILGCVVPRISEGAK